MLGDYPNLEPVLTRPINWDLIVQQYDEMIKYAAAMKKGAKLLQMRVVTINDVVFCTLFDGFPASAAA